MKTPEKNANWPQAHLVRQIAGTLYVDPRDLLGTERVPAWTQDPRNGLLDVNSLTNAPGFREHGAMSPSSGWIYGGAALAQFLDVSTWTVREWADDPASPICRWSSSFSRGARSIFAAEAEAALRYKAEMVDRRYDSRVENSPYTKS